MNPSQRKRRKLWLLGGVFIALAALGPLLGSSVRSFAQESAPAATLAPFDTPTTSSPIALSQDKQFIWVVNPDDGSVSVLGDLDGTPRVLRTIKGVGKEPQAVALDVGNHAYVASPPDNGVRVIEITNASVNNFSASVKNLLVTGAEPWNLVASPDGSRIFVANSGQDTITVIRTDTQSIVGSVDLRNSPCNVDDQNRRFQPRGLAVTLDGTRLYVARFFSYTKSGGRQGVDGDKEGVVCQLDIPASITALPTVANAVRIAALPTGFNQPNGVEAIAHPNQMQSIVIYRDQVYLPNIGAATAGPDRFNSSTMALVNVIDNANTGVPVDAPTKSINLHLGARVPEAGKKKLFFANPWAIGFRNNAGNVNAYAVSAGSDMLVKLNVDATGDLTFTVGVSTTRYIDLNDPTATATSGANAGKNPQGIVIRGNKAFVMNYISRNVSMVNLDTDTVERVIQTTPLPLPGSFEEQLLVGNEMFNSSRGHFNRPVTLTVSTDDRLSFEGWQNCASCHFEGGTDANVWFFGSGPRKSIPLNNSWNPHNPDDQRLFNYSAIFAEVQTFELNIRNTSGNGPLAAAQPCSDPAPGAATTSLFNPNFGLILGDVDANKAPCVINQFLKRNSGRNQLTVTLPGSNKAWPALDAMAEWVRFNIRTPEGALTTAQLPANQGGYDAAQVSQGRRLFFRAGCHECHGGAKWTISTKDPEVFTPVPPAAALEVESPLTQTQASQLQVFVGLENNFLRNIESFNLNVPGIVPLNQIPGQPLIGATEVNNGGAKALGIDHNGNGKGKGYNVPGLLGIGLMPPYYHNGACETLACVLANPTHRKAGLNPGQADPFDGPNGPAAQAAVVAWMETLDADTEFPLNLSVRPHDIFFDPQRLVKGAQAKVGANIQLFGTKADLADLLGDLNVPNIKVNFSLQIGNEAPTSIGDVNLTANSFRQDFGTATISTTVDLPANPSSNTVVFTVQIDPDGQVIEARENDNRAARTKILRNAAADNIPPVVGTGVGDGVFISDDDPFNNSDPIAVSQNVKVKFTATDQGSGLRGYCVVRYRFNAPTREWLPFTCSSFTVLPPATEPNTFIVDVPIVSVAGVTYAFVWVQDNAGNISAVPGFDVISYVPSTPVELRRNDVRIFRIPLAVGQSQVLSFDPDVGDVDVLVFDDFTDPDAELVDSSANNGDSCEEVTLTAIAGQPNRFQVEVKAVANSRFTIKLEPCAVTEVTASAAPSDVQQTDDSPIISGPPALRAAIEDEEVTAASSIYLPLVVK